MVRSASDGTPQSAAPSPAAATAAAPNAGPQLRTATEVVEFTPSGLRDASSIADPATHLVVIKQGRFLGFRSNAAGGKLLQVRKRGASKLCFFNFNFGINEQWETDDEPHGEGWSTAIMRLRNRRLPSFVLTVEVMRIPSSLRPQYDPFQPPPSVGAAPHPSAVGASGIGSPDVHALTPGLTDVAESSCGNGHTANGAPAGGSESGRGEGGGVGGGGEGEVVAAVLAAGAELEGVGDHIPTSGSPTELSMKEKIAFHETKIKSGMTSPASTPGGGGGGGGVRGGGGGGNHRHYQHARAPPPGHQHTGADDQGNALRSMSGRDECSTLTTSLH